MPVGYIGRPNNTPGGLRPAGAVRLHAGGGGGGRGGRGGNAGTTGPFNATSKFAFVTTQANKEEVERAQRATRVGRAAGGVAAAGNAAGAADREGGANRTSLVIINLADGKQTTVADARNIRVPRFNGTWLVYSPGADSAARAAGDTTAGAAAAGRAGGGGRGGRGGGGGAAAPGARVPTATRSCCATSRQARKNASPMCCHTRSTTALKCSHTRLHHATAPRTACICATCPRAR